MNRTIKDTTVKRYYKLHEQLKSFADLSDGLQLCQAIEDTKRPAPYEFVCKTWTNEPEHLRINPIRDTVGLNT